MPGISVITPVFQSQDLLGRCVKSVREQTFSDWELILIDDGSTDNSPALCDRFAASDNRIRAFHQPRNSGVSAARNRGLLEARGEYVVFLDADDAYIPQTLETLWNLRLRSGAQTAGCAICHVTPLGRERVELLLPEGFYSRLDIQEKIIAPLFGERLKAPIFNGYSVRYLFSLARIRELDLNFKGAYLEDDLFVLEYFSGADSLAVTEQPLYYYIQNPQSATRHYMPNIMSVLTEYMDRKAELAEKYNLDQTCPNWRDNSNWANLFIAVANEYAHGNSKTMREREIEIQALCSRPEMAGAIERLKPEGMGRNKQIVAFLIRKRWFSALTLLYRLKNRI